MIDERHFIYSIAAVFFALAIGIVIGTSMARSPAGQSEQATIRQYEGWMRNLRAEIEGKSKDVAKMELFLRKNEEFCQAAMPIVARNRLAWRNVAIIRTGDFDDLTGSVKRGLEIAGAQVISVTEISRDFPFSDDERTSEALINNGIWTSPEVEKPSEKLWRIIGGAVASAQHNDLLPKLEEAGVATFTGRYDRPVRLVVIVGGSISDDTNTADAIDARLLAQLQRPNLTVVGCEPSSAGSSYVPVWRKIGIATVDNAELAIGQISLVCALGGERASFGFKDTADRTIPQTLETQ